ncbi:RNA demethylase ALKBH10B-like [Impatiens glandulifera]|uniref:RNA demethylase ALKBH10B-like n=1 Tax=Impatiens glandulifera TaxID=253017 RepID=UPI001FB15112|nr:RNA demethylase ALKBH10B-like [Impatiens glandulifera]
MSLAAGPKSKKTTGTIVTPVTAWLASVASISDPVAKDAIFAWYRTEFAAANAIIDVLCGHLMKLDNIRGGERPTYQSVLDAIHCRRFNWIPMLHMQKYFSIADIKVEVQRAMEMKMNSLMDREFYDQMQIQEMNDGLVRGRICGVVTEEDNLEINEVTDGDDSLESSIETGFDQSKSVCTDHDGCEERGSNVKIAKRFKYKELVNGRRVNIVRGLKLYENIFSEVELSALNEFVSKLHIAGQNGELSGETFILYNQHIKGEKRELIQLGVPIFEQAIYKDQEGYKKIEPIPPILQSVIDHLVQWNLIPDERKPNSCIINFYDEGEYSSPFLKPPHVEQPISILNLSESTMTFGRTLVHDDDDFDGNFYKGPLMVSLNEGSLLLMRGNSCEMTRHVTCPSPNKRVTLSFFRVRPNTRKNLINSYAVDVMMGRCFPMVLNSNIIPTQNGTGVYLPWSSPRSPKQLKTGKKAATRPTKSK